MLRPLIYFENIFYSQNVCSKERNARNVREIINENEGETEGKIGK
jgi:hypothetical protein